MPKRKWKYIEGYEYKYQVSNLGDVRSLLFDRKKILKPYIETDGYCIVYLYKYRKSKSYRIHRLVANAFLPNPNNLPFVNHKIDTDEGKSMNFVFFNEDGSVDEEKTTIEWATYEENNNYGTRNERIAKTMSKKVLQLSLTGELIREWESTKECGRNGFNQGNIVSCCNGKRKSVHGFRWEYA